LDRAPQDATERKGREIRGPTSISTEEGRGEEEEDLVDRPALQETRRKARSGLDEKIEKPLLVRATRERA